MRVGVMPSVMTGGWSVSPNRVRQRAPARIATPCPTRGVAWGGRRLAGRLEEEHQGGTEAGEQERLVDQQADQPCGAHDQQAERERVGAAAGAAGPVLGGTQQAGVLTHAEPPLAIKAWGAACLMRVLSQRSCRWVSESQESTTSISCRSRTPCAAWPRTVQVMSTKEASR